MRATARTDAETLEELSSATRQEGPLADTTLLNFATDGRVRGKVVLTTFHSSKGRQFDVVVIPGLAEGIMPPWRWSRGQYHPPGGKVLGEARRLFYVGFTRARNSVHLIYSGAYVQKGHLVSLGVSRFVKESWRSSMRRERLELLNRSFAVLGRYPKSQSQPPDFLALSYYPS